MDEHVAQTPSLVRLKAEQLGSQGEQWLAALPEQIAYLERAWAITVGAPFTSGSASYVARARAAAGHDAVLKIALPGQGFRDQLRTLASAHGRGYVRLLAYDREREAMLLEALGPALDQLALPPERVIETLCQTLGQAWQAPRPAGPAVMTGDEKATWLGRSISRRWERMGRPCSQRVVALVLRYAERRAAAFDLARSVVVHGDPHPGNALQALTPRAGAESGFVFVDPDGFLAEPAYDLGVVLRDWSQQLLAGDAVTLAREYCGLMSAHTGVEEAAIWEWGFIERVSTGLYILDLGAEDLAHPFLASAELLA